MNCLLGLPEPHIFKVAPSSIKRTKTVVDYSCLSLWDVFMRCVCAAELITFGFVRLVNERWQHMTIFYVEVVVRTEHIGQYDCCVTMTILPEVCPVNTETIKHVSKQAFVYFPRSHAQMIRVQIWHSPYIQLRHTGVLTRNLIPSRQLFLPHVSVTEQWLVLLQKGAATS